MCGPSGPSGSEEALANQEASLSTSLMNAFNDRLGKQNNILGQVQAALGQLQSGNFPPGYSPSVMSALQTKALNQVAGATRSAQQAAGNAIAGQGGGAGSSLESGIQQQIRGSIAATGATQQADLLNQLNIKSYDVGRENLLQSISGLQALAGAENPEAFASGASATNQQAFGQAGKIRQEKAQAAAGKWGAITGIAEAGLNLIPGVGPALSAGLKTLSGGGGISNPQEQAIGNQSASNYSDWTSSLGASPDWVPGMDEGQ